MLEYYYKEGYRYVALGSMVPLAGNRKKALKIVAGITNLKKPKIGKKKHPRHMQGPKNEIAYFGTEQP